MSSLFKRKGLGPSQSTPYSNHEFTDADQTHGQDDELDDYHQDESAGYEHDNFDNEPHVMVEPQQSMPQPTQHMPMKKIFPTSPAPMTATTVPVQSTTPTPAPTPMQSATAPVIATAAVTTHDIARPQQTNMVQMSTKIDRVLHGRLRYLSFKTGKTQTTLIEEFIRLHCPEVP
jgi:hypothetical protein